MEYLKILKNNNTIYSGTRNVKCSQQQAADFTMRFVFSGNENYSIGRRNLTIYPDSFLVLNKGTQYSSVIDCPFPVHTFAISFGGKFIDNLRSSDETFAPFCDNGHDFEFNETIYPLKGDMFFNVKQLKYHLDNGMDDETLINKYISQCLTSYFKIYSEEISQKTGRLNFFHESTRVEILRRLNLAKEYLYTNYNRNIGLDELAEYSCLSVNHLLRTFKQAFNLTPHQFLIQVRLQRAQVLLRNTNYPVAEVVSLIGFECPSSFIRLFREHFKPPRLSTGKQLD